MSFFICSMRLWLEADNLSTLNGILVWSESEETPLYLPLRIERRSESGSEVPNAGSETSAYDLRWYNTLDVRFNAQIYGISSISDAIRMSADQQRVFESCYEYDEFRFPDAQSLNRPVSQKEKAIRDALINLFEEGREDAFEQISADELKSLICFAALRDQGSLVAEEFLSTTHLAIDDMISVERGITMHRDHVYRRDGHKLKLCEMRRQYDPAQFAYNAESSGLQALWGPRKQKCIPLIDDLEVQGGKILVKAEHYGNTIILKEVLDPIGREWPIDEKLKAADYYALIKSRAVEKNDF